jgi:hypothetical protein
VLRSSGAVLQLNGPAIVMSSVALNGAASTTGLVVTGLFGGVVQGSAVGLRFVTGSFTGLINSSSPVNVTISSGFQMQGNS